MYYWIGADGGWKIGRDTEICLDDDMTIMVRWHTGEIEPVPLDALARYPTEPIDEPQPKQGATK